MSTQCFHEVDVYLPTEGDGGCYWTGKGTPHEIVERIEDNTGVMQRGSRKRKG
jgi:hypothetical protein